MKKQEIIEKYTTWTSDMRQKYKIEKDLEELNKLEENEYYLFFTRQYAGHRNRARRVNNKFDILFVSKAVSWTSWKQGNNFVIC